MAGPSVAEGSLVKFGVIDPKWRADDPADTYFSVYSFPPANVLALAMAIAAAQLAGAGSNQENGQLTRLLAAKPLARRTEGPTVWVEM